MGLKFEDDYEMTEDDEEDYSIATETEEVSEQALVLMLNMKYLF